MDPFGLKAKEKVVMLEVQIEALEKSSKRYKEECDEFHKRCKQLEDAFEREQGIKIRQEITNVIADFDKVEMVIIFAAIAKLISLSSNPDDIRVYLKLNDKIILFINDMDEKKEEKAA